MTLTFKIDWDNGIKKNKDFLLSEEMWEKSFGLNSTFYKYYTENQNDEDLISTLQCFKNEKLVGVLIFPRLESETLTLNIDNKKRLFYSLGEIQLYVKPEFRNEGIASKMVRKFDNLLYEDIKDRFNEDLIYVLQATQKAVTVASRNMKNFPVYNVFGLHDKLLKDRIRSDYPYNNNKLKTLSEWKEFKQVV